MAILPREPDRFPGIVRMCHNRYPFNDIRPTGTLSMKTTAGGLFSVGSVSTLATLGVGQNTAVGAGAIGRRPYRKERVLGPLDFNVLVGNQPYLCLIRLTQRSVSTTLLMVGSNH